MRTQNYHVCECGEIIPDETFLAEDECCSRCNFSQKANRIKPVLALIFDAELERSQYAAYLSAMGGKA